MDIEYEIWCRLSISLSLKYLRLVQDWEQTRDAAEECITDM